MTEDSIAQWRVMRDHYRVRNAHPSMGINRGQRATWEPTGEQCTFMGHCTNLDSGEESFAFVFDDGTFAHASQMYWVFIDTLHGDFHLRAEP